MPERYLNGGTGTPQSSPRPNLIIWPLSDPPLLAWSMLVSFATPEGSNVVAEYVIDANTGNIIRSHDAMRRLAIGTQTDGSSPGVYGDRTCKPTDSACYDMKQFPVVAGGTAATPLYSLEQFQSATAANIYVAIPDPKVRGKINELTSKDKHQWERTGADPGSAVDAYYYLVQTEQWWRNHGMTHSYNNMDGTLRILAHDPDPELVNDAKWNPVDKTIHIGVASKQLPVSAGLDVMAHEYTHAVVKTLLDLSLVGPPAAFEESLADIFGQFVEYDYNPRGGNPLPYAANRQVIGEAINGPSGTRDLVSPHNGVEKTLDHVNDHSAPRNDEHTFAGIFNAAWGLIAFGGTNSTSKVKVPQGIGFELSQLLYLAVITKKSISQVSSYDGIGFAISDEAKQAFLGADLYKTVPCAMYAVGALTKTQIESTYGIKLDDPYVCPPEPKQDDMSRSSSDMSGSGICLIGHPCTSDGCCVVVACPTPTTVTCSCHAPCPP
jgi:Zn-dependent metalloprotease